MTIKPPILCYVGGEEPRGAGGKLGQQPDVPGPGESSPRLRLELPGRVLLIDDSPVVLETVGSLMEGWGHTVVTAERADLGLEALARSPFDVVVADVNMPGMDGLDLLAAVRARSTDIPVVMLSSATETRIVLRAIHAGAFDYVNKDDGLEPLGSAVRRALDHARLVQENRRLIDEQRRMNLWLENKVRERTLELEELNRHLTTERSELARALGALRETQSQLIQAEKMATIGLFTAGIAHEINNPLAFLLPDFEHLEQWVAAYRSGRDPGEVMTSDDLEQLLKDCRHGLQRIGRIVKQISVFAHQSPHDLARVELGSVVGTVFRMLDKETQRIRARLKTQAAESAAVRANADQLQQVLFNLTLNALQGLDPLRTDGCVEIDAKTHGADIVISVSDNGRGIPTRNLERVFEPFFTTKKVGEGTGLGLSICRRLVQRMGGRLELTSREGVGTTAYLVLPAWEAAAGAAAEDPLAGALAEPEDPSRRLLVAVVDDEPALLQAMKRMLSDDHEVVTFTEAVEAKEWLLFGPRPDLVFCDIMMPVLSGIDLFQEVTRAHPGLASRFVLLTGAAQGPEVDALLKKPEVRVVEKPLERQNLLALCREIAGSAGQHSAHAA
jgi:signal transduction histidine kinase